MKKAITTTALLLFFGSFACCQNRKVIEQIWEEYQAAASDTARQRHLFRLAYNQYAYFNLDSAQFLLGEMRRLHSKTHTSKGRYQILVTASFIENRKLNFDQSIAFLDSARMMMHELNDRSAVVRVFNNLGGIYQRKGDFKTALRYLHDAKNSCPPEDKEQMWTTLSNIAAAYGNMQMVSESIKYSAEALELARSYNNPADQLHNIYTLFKNYSFLLDLPNMAKWAALLDSLSQITQNNLHFYRAALAKGDVAYQKRDFATAKSAYENAIMLGEKTKIPNYIFDPKMVLVDTYIELGEFQKALQLIEELKAAADRNGSYLRSRKSLFFGQEARIRLKMNNDTGAATAIQTMENLADTFQNRVTLRLIYADLSKTYVEDKQDFENGYKYYLKYAALQDSIFSSEKIREAAGLELRYTFEKEKSEQAQKLLQLENQNLAADLRIREQQAALFKGKSDAEKREILLRLLHEEQARQTLFIENQSFTLEQQQLLTRSQADSLALLGKENELLEKDRALQKAAIFQQRVWLALAVLGGLLLAATLYFSYRRRQQRQLERLRLEIARDLHDEIGSSIGSIALFGKSLQKMLGDTRPDAAAGLEKISQNAENSLEALRDIVWTIDLRHDTVEDFSARAHEWILPACAAAGVACDLRADLAEPAARLHPNLKKNGWLFLKEAVANSLRYSETEKLEVVLAFQKKEIRLEVRDFGIGFDPANARTGGNGLKNMELRAQEIGGVLDLKTEIGRGTSMVLTCPSRNE